VTATDLRGARSIVLGANGYIGRHLVHGIRAAGGDVLAFDVQEEPAVTGVQYQRLDVSESVPLERLDWSVDVVHHLAGLTGTHNGFEQYARFVQVNEVGLLNVLGAIRKSGHRPRVVFPSTRLVYRGSDEPLREAAAKAPRTVYAVNKLACENLLEAYRNAFDLAFTVYRICVPYGSLPGGGYSYGTVGALIRQAQEARCIRLYGDGSLRRTFSHVSDVCRQVLDTCRDERSSGEIFNVGGDDHSLGEAASWIAERFGARVEHVEWPPGDLRIESGHTVFDGAKLQGLLASPPEHRFREWVRSSPELDR
jgi:UDP-glucose 4-epimerase